MPGRYLGPVTLTERPDVGACHVIAYCTDFGAGRITVPAHADADVLIEITGARPFRLTKDGAIAIRDALDELLEGGDAWPEDR